MADVRIALVDDHPLFRNALAHVLQAADSDLDLVEAGSLEDLLHRLDQGLEIDLLTLDLSLPGIHGLLGLLYFRKTHPSIPVMVISANTSTAILPSCMMLGASAYVPKSASAAHLRDAVRTVLAGGTWLPGGHEAHAVCDSETRDLVVRLAALSSRELEVSFKLLDGRLNKQIGRELGISEATAKAHVSSILDKLKVLSRTQVVLMLKGLEQRVQ